MELYEAAEILAKGCRGISVYGDRGVAPWQVSQIASEWLKLTEGDRWRQPIEKPSGFWRRLLRRSPTVTVRQERS